jgi:hypothetical protein
MNKQDWLRVVRANVNKIVTVHKSAGGGSHVCVLFELQGAREGRLPPGILEMIVNTRLDGAIPVQDPDQARRFACLPVHRQQLLASLEKYSTGIDELGQGLKGGESLALWAICCTDDTFFAFDIHEWRPEHN